MKCKYCGGDVTLDDHFCPHCGRPVDQAQRHQLEMEQYEAEFDKTRKEALKKISASSVDGTAFGIRLAAIAVLIGILIFMVISLDPYTMNERKQKRLAKSNYDTYVAQIEQYLEDRDYVALASFDRIHQLDYNDDYKGYREIFYNVSYYTSLYRGLQELAFVNQNNSKYMYYAQEVSKYLNQLYEEMGRDLNTDWVLEPEKTKGFYEEMQEETSILLQRYLGLSKEEADSLRGLSKSRRTVIVEQALDKVLSEKTGSGLPESTQ